MNTYFLSFENVTYKVKAILFLGVLKDSKSQPDKNCPCWVS